SSLVSFSRSNAEGFFSIKGLSSGKYRLLVTHIGFRNLDRDFVINEHIPVIDFGSLPLLSKSNMLEEVTVVAEAPPVTIRNDTLEFNAGSFKTKPNAVVEDLLKKLPGIQVDKDGKIKANGEEVKKVLVDGKEFFGNDPKMATKNLPSDVVDKVQVFDRKSDQSRFSGFDDGNSEKTINLTIKQDKKNGLFGRATVGAGDQGRYEGKMNVNSFSGDRQMSAIGMANNTNKQGFSFMDILNFSGGLPGAGGGKGGNIDISSSGLSVQGGGPGGGSSNPGITTTWAGGLNYNNSLQKKMDLTGSYFYNKMENEKLEKMNQQWLIPGNNYTTVKDNKSIGRNESHRVNFANDYKIDSMNSLRISSSLNYQQSDLASSSEYNSVSAKGQRLNGGIANSYIKGDGYNWNSNALFRHRFPKKGRTFSANIGFGINQTQSDGRLSSENAFYNPDGSLKRGDTLNQINNQDADSKNYSAVLSFTEALSKISLLELNYNVASTLSESARNTFDYDKSTGKHSVINDALTTKFSNEYTYHRPGLNWRLQGKKVTLAIGSSMQFAKLKSDFNLLSLDSSLQRSFTNFLPNANMQYSINRYKNLRFFYNAMTRQPSVSQLQPIDDNTDPLNIRRGNPDLQQEYTHRLNANYSSFDPFQKTSFFASLNASLTNDRIVNADFLSAQGERITQPVNANGVYTVSGNASWGFAVKKLKSTVNLNTSASAGRNLAFINSQKNNIRSWNGNAQLTWSYNYKEMFDFTAGVSAGYNNVNYSLQTNQDSKYWTQQYSFETNFYFPAGFSISSEMDYNTRSVLVEGYNANYFIWNAGLAKQLFKNKRGELRLHINDILNQNIGVNRNANQNYIEDVSYNVLKRYGQLSFTYNINKFAGKNLPFNKNSGTIKVIGN
ncbi:MAG: outer membrane beta-barrel protein, partial [Gemmatimonadaceae bacterium]|nr:outer membrane beta-barrel protein [Chitinophagaceae bacterium]